MQMKNHPLFLFLFSDLQRGLRNNDLQLRSTNGLEDSTLVEMTTSRPPLSTKPAQPGELPRHYRIFPDYGTDFIWRSPDDTEEENDEESYVEAEEVLSSFPPLALKLYNAWVDCYCDYFKTRLEHTTDYTANVFLSVSEEVPWKVAGYLLAWRIAISPQIGSIEYSAGHSTYLIEKGNETSVTVTFLQDQMELLAKGEPTD